MTKHYRQTHDRLYVFLEFNFLARKCEDPIPEPYLGIDVVWKNNKNRDLGAKIDYVCPFRRATETLTLKGELLMFC